MMLLKCILGTRREDLDWIHFSWEGPVLGCCENGNELPNSMNDGITLWVAKRLTANKEKAHRHYFTMITLKIMKMEKEYSTETLVPTCQIIMRYTWRRTSVNIPWLHSDLSFNVLKSSLPPRKSLIQLASASGLLEHLQT
jgi:hypothetical protein